MTSSALTVTSKVLVDVAPFNVIVAVSVTVTSSVPRVTIALAPSISIALSSDSQVIVVPFKPSKGNSKSAVTSSSSIVNASFASSTFS